MRYWVLILAFLSTTAWAEGATAGAQSQALNQTMMLVLLFVVFYFMLIRPQNKRAKAHQQLVKQLNKGDEVVTTGGLLGRVLRITEEIVVLSIAEGIEVKVQKMAIVQALPKGTLKSND